MNIKLGWLHYSIATNVCILSRLKSGFKSSTISFRRAVCLPFNRIKLTLCSVSSFNNQTTNRARKKKRTKKVRKRERTAAANGVGKLKIWTEFKDKIYMYVCIQRQTQPKWNGLFKVMVPLYNCPFCTVSRFCTKGSSDQGDNHEYD